MSRSSTRSSMVSVFFLTFLLTRNIYICQQGSPRVFKAIFQSELSGHGGSHDAENINDAIILLDLLFFNYPNILICFVQLLGDDVIISLLRIIQYLPDIIIYVLLLSLCRYISMHIVFLVLNGNIWQFISIPGKADFIFIVDMGSILLTWFTFNPSMDKWSHNYLVKSL